MGNPIDDTPEGIAAMRAADENNLPANPPEEVEAGHEHDEPHNHDGSTPHSHEQPMGMLASMIASVLGMGPRPPQESLTPEEIYRTSVLIKVAEKSLDNVSKIIRILPAFARRVVLIGVREWLNSLEGKLDQMEENDFEAMLAQSIRDGVILKKAENLKPIHEDPAVQPEDNAKR